MPPEGCENKERFKSFRVLLDIGDCLPEHGDVGTLETLRNLYGALGEKAGQVKDFYTKPFVGLKEKTYHRSSPLINLGMSLFALGEGIVEACYGDIEAALWSFNASFMNFVVGIAPYVREGQSINGMGLMLNGASLIAWELNHHLVGTRSRSISYSIYPMMCLSEIGMNFTEFNKGSRSPNYAELPDSAVVKPV